MRFISSEVTRTIGRGILEVKKNSPHLFFGAGVAGVVGGAVLACKATLKLEETVDKIKEDLEAVTTLGTEAKNDNKIRSYSEQDYYKDLGFVYGASVVRIGKLYGPAIIVGGIGIACLTGSHVQLTRRNAALTMTLAAVSKAYDAYRERVQAELGKSRELELYHNVQDEEVEIDGKTQIVKSVNPDGVSVYARFFDEYSANWQKDNEMNRIFIQVQQTYANHLLQARGHVLLNDVYDSLGLERTTAGAVVGWVLNSEVGDNHIDFGIFEVRNARFVNGIERSILLDFNVDGVIYDLLDKI